MNHIYRTIYNTATQTWQVASELAKTQGTLSSQPASQNYNRHRHRTGFA